MEDELETTGRRALLNLGHTFGHALEAETHFSKLLLHGEAVALGCVLAFALSAERGFCPPADTKRVEGHFTAVGLPTTLGGLGLRGRGRAIAGHMMNDKKRNNGRLPLVLAKRIGEAFLDATVEMTELAAFLDRAD
jgi:3-dehydroquinate synthase